MILRGIAMKKSSLFLFVSCLCLTPVAMAEQSVSIGYAQGKVTDGDTVRGVNVKYNYEFSNQWGVLASTTYMQGDSSVGANQLPDISPDKWGEASRDTKYFSVMAGPSYRINNNINVYGVVGIARTSAKGQAQWLNHEGGKYVHRGDFSVKDTSTGLGYGAGVQINPTANIVVDLAYEGARSSNALENKNLNAFNVGLGYRF